MKILKWIKDLFSDQKKTTVSVSGNSIHKEKDVMNIEAENSDVKIENYHLSNLKGILVIVIVLLMLIVIVIVASILHRFMVRRVTPKKIVILQMQIRKKCSTIGMYMEIMMG